MSPWSLKDVTLFGNSAPADVQKRRMERRSQGMRVGPKSSDRVLRKGHTGRRPCDGVKAETGVTQLQTEDTRPSELEEAGRRLPRAIMALLTLSGLPNC